MSAESYVVEWFEPNRIAGHEWQQSGEPTDRRLAGERARSLRHRFEQEGVATPVRVRPVGRGA